MVAWFGKTTTQAHFETTCGENEGLDGTHTKIRK